MTKEELTERFEKFVMGWILSPEEKAKLFDFFYSEIERREELLKVAKESCWEEKPTTNAVIKGIKKLNF